MPAEGIERLAGRGAGEAEAEGEAEEAAPAVVERPRLTGESAGRVGGLLGHLGVPQQGGDLARARARLLLLPLGFFYGLILIRGSVRGGGTLFPLGWNVIPAGS